MTSERSHSHINFALCLATADSLSQDFELVSQNTPIIWHSYVIREFIRTVWPRTDWQQAPNRKYPTSYDFWQCLHRRPSANKTTLKCRSMRAVIQRISTVLQLRGKRFTLPAWDYLNFILILSSFVRFRTRVYEFCRGQTYATDFKSIEWYSFSRQRRNKIH